ncbi:ATP/GTP-binding protein [Leptolyngbya sp. FACHB-261]|uniref:GTP-binding protein n=1 Tax=Leptolyngbya sp. FACHB-261 TaxID=2692806 RepID=UPI001686CA54|nr:ATP/GTP-binding protein [Leptolyngbya sp. FACHB-261]MBD2103575.1 ATP/GTP-binding protein [Leptolyngbya sp. FACHB-261]
MSAVPLSQPGSAQPRALSQILRVVITGPVGAGKSTYIETTSEIEVVRTERQACTPATRRLKPETTVAMDFGRITLNPRMAVHLYGTPGQMRFDFMWDLLIQRAHGYVLLVAAHRPAQFETARYIHRFMSERTLSPCVIGLTHLDSPDAWPPVELLLALGFDRQTCPPVIGVNTQERRSVARSLLLLAQHMSRSRQSTKAPTQPPTNPASPPIAFSA